MGKGKKSPSSCGRGREGERAVLSLAPDRSYPLCPQGSEVLEQVLHTLSKSGSLEELVLDNAGLKT